MKKVLSLVMFAVLLIAGYSFASPRSTGDSEGKTVFTNIAVTGEDVDGVPGYIEMTTSFGQTYYLYIDDNYKLRIASGAQVGSSTASPSIADWNNAGTVVGSQS